MLEKYFINLFRTNCGCVVFVSWPTIKTGLRKLLFTTNPCRCLRIIIIQSKFTTLQGCESKPKVAKMSHKKADQNNFSKCFFCRGSGFHAPNLHWLWPCKGPGPYGQIGAMIRLGHSIGTHSALTLRSLCAHSLTTLGLVSFLCPAVQGYRDVSQLSASSRGGAPLRP